MPTFGPKSRKQLDTLDEDLQRVLKRAILDYDFSVIQGYRDMEDQNRQFNEGDSTLRWPQSKHNTNPSMAVDIIPYPTGYDDIPQFFKMATYIFVAAAHEGVLLRWGGHWKNFKDYPHFELIQ